MRRSILLALALVLMHAAGAQATDATPPPQNKQIDDPTGAVGTSAKDTGPPEYVPLTASERFRLYLRRTYGIPSLFESAAEAAVDQWRNRPTEWKQGDAAYGDRFGSSYATQIIWGTLEYGASAALREDNRYVRSRETGVWQRSWHAITNTFLARNDAGDEHFAYSRFGSAVGAAFISRIWQPHSTDTAGAAALNFGATIGGDAAENILREFWPDLKRHLFKRKQ